MQHLGTLRRDQITHHAREPRGAVILARESDGDADREQQAEVREDRIAGGGDRRDIEQIGLAESQQQRGDRQHRDRQHQGAADLLQAGENVLHGCTLGNRFCAASSAARRRIDGNASARCASARHASRLSAPISALICGMLRGHGGQLVHAEP